MDPRERLTEVIERRWSGMDRERASNELYEQLRLMDSFEILALAHAVVPNCPVGASRQTLIALIIESEVGEP